MAILDRPMFQRRLTKDELRGYGIPAFANGGVVKMKKGGDPLGLFTPGGLGQKIKEDKEKKPKVMLSDIFGDTNIQDRIEPETALTDFVRPTGPATGMTIPSSVYEEEETVTDTTPTFPPGALDSTLRLEAEQKAERKNKKDDEPKPVDDTEELKKKYLKESKLLKEILGDNKEMVKRQGFLQLAQFGLNLASAQGSNFLDKVAKSAKDPLNAFAELGRKAFEDERAIELMALEQVRAKEAADLEYERELAKEERQAALAKELQQMKVAGAEDDLLKIYKSAYGEEAGERKFLEYKEAGTGATKTDFVAGIVSDLIATGQYSGDEGLTEATRLAQDIGDKIYGPGEDEAVANQGDIKKMSSESDWQNIKVGEQFVLPNGQTGTKTGNSLTDYTLG
jgi:hypothetical protein